MGITHLEFTLQTHEKLIANIYLSLDVYSLNSNC